MEFARIEIDIEKEAMAILRSFCRTKAATESFDHFEYLIGKKHFESVRTQGLPQPRVAASRDNGGRKISNTRPVAASHNPKTERRILSGNLPQRIFRKASSTIPQPKVEKSVTIGNFASTKFYLNSDSSPEGLRHRTKSLQQDGTASLLPRPCGQDDRKHTRCTIPKSQDGDSRVPLRTPSNDQLNTKFSRNFSHRDLKQTITLVDGGSSSNPMTGQAATDSSPGIPSDSPPDCSRRFRKSDSIKQLVDLSIREVKEMGKRGVTTGATDGFDEA